MSGAYRNWSKNKKTSLKSVHKHIKHLPKQYSTFSSSSSTSYKHLQDHVLPW